MRRHPYSYARLIGIAVIVILIGAIPSTLQANSGLFESAILYNYGGANHRPLAAGDFNNDGRLDVAAKTDTILTIFEQTADHTLVPSQHFWFWYGEAEAGDFNNDGLTDLATSYIDTDEPLFLQQPGGGLAAQELPLSHLFSQYGKLWTVRVGDVSGNTLDDIVYSATLGQNTDPRLIIVPQDESGLGTPLLYPAAGGYREFSLGDINDDGRTDIVGLYGDLYLHYQEEDGSFGTPVLLDIDLGFSVSVSQGGLNVGDVTGDELPDIIIAVGGNVPNSALVVYPQNSDGTMGDAVVYDALNIPEEVELADVNDDGRTDVLTSSNGWPDVALYLQAADGSLNDLESYRGIATSSIAINDLSLVMADVSDDDEPDMVTGESLSGLTVLYNANPQQDLPVPPTYPPQPTAPIFSSYTSMFPSTAIPTIAEGDFNYDGLSDLVISSTQVMLQLEQGGFATPYSIQGGDDSSAVGDLNGDGRDDVASADLLSDSIYINLQTDTGLPGVATRIITDVERPVALAIGDVNNDQRDDLIATLHNSSDLAVFYQTAAGELASPVLYPKIEITYYQATEEDIAIADVNSDGLNDVILVWANAKRDPMVVLYQTETGELSAPEGQGIASVGTAVATGDVTGDGQANIILTRGGNQPTSHIVVAAYDESGDVLPISVHPVLDIPSTVRVADVNGDQLDDVVLVHHGWARIGVLLQTPEHALAPEQLYSIPVTNFDHETLAIGDFNGDCALDAAVADESSNGLAIVYNANVNAVFCPFELLTNGSFEDGDTLPAGWQIRQAGLSKVGWVCDPLESLTGDCAMALAGKSGNRAAIFMEVRKNGGAAGERFEVSGFVRGQGTTAAVGGLGVQVFHEDGSKRRYYASFPEGEFDWQKFTTTFTTQQPYTRIYVGVLVRPQGGIYWVDDLSLLLDE